MAGPSEIQFDSGAPRHTVDLRGQEDAERVLLDSWRSGRMPHAWLFTGPKGVGKSTLAFRLARYILKQTSQNAESNSSSDEDLFGVPAAKSAMPELADSLYISSDDPVFKRIASFGHADVMTIERSWNEKSDKLFSEIRVDDVRKLGHFFSLSAAEGGYRIAILDAADDMNRNAANALLKILEEPPAKSLLIVVAHAPGALLPTIRSRCHVLPLRPLPDNIVSEILQSHIPDAANEDAALMARLSEGSPGRAMALWEAGGLEACTDLRDLLERLENRDPVKLHALADKLARGANVARFNVFIDLLLWWLARMIRLAAAPRPGIELWPGENALIARLAQWQSLDRWVDVWEKSQGFVTRADALALDKKQTLLTLVFDLERVRD